MGIFTKDACEAVFRGILGFGFSTENKDGHGQGGEYLVNLPTYCNPNHWSSVPCHDIPGIKLPFLKKKSKRLWRYAVCPIWKGIVTKPTLLSFIRYVSGGAFCLGSVTHTKLRIAPMIEEMGDWQAASGFCRFLKAELLNPRLEMCIGDIWIRYINLIYDAIE